MKTKGIIGIFLPLMLICAIIAGVVAGVNMLTLDKIAENERVLAERREAEKLAFIAEIYGDKTEFTVDEDCPDTVDEIRRAETGEACVTVTVDGYKKKSIQLFVALDANGSVLRVRVLASNETTGIGTKVNSEDYLAQYEGKTGVMSFGKDGIDKIAGATISSNGVLKGVNLAREAAGFGG